MIEIRQASMLRKSASFKSCDPNGHRTATVGLRRNLYLNVRPPSHRLPSQRLTAISLCWRQHQTAAPLDTYRRWSSGGHAARRASVGRPEDGSGGCPATHSLRTRCSNPPHPDPRPCPGSRLFCLATATISHCRLWRSLLIRVKLLSADVRA